MRFDLGHHLLFQGQIFKYRLNHHIAMAESAVIRGTGDQRQLAIALTGFDMAAFDLLIKQLPAVLQGVVDPFRIDVFDPHR